MEEVFRILGYAMVPFVISAIYGCNDFLGSKKIAWIKDVLALIVATGAYVAVVMVAETPLHDAVGLVGVVAAAGLGWLAMAVILPITYKVLYAGAPADADASPAAH